MSYPWVYDDAMKDRTRSKVTSLNKQREHSALPAGCRQYNAQSTDPTSGLTLGNELLELCTEVAGALLRGYSEGKSGTLMRRAIAAGLVEKMSCPEALAENLIDLSLELIHFQAYGSFRSDCLELSLLVAKSGGEVSDESLN